MNTHTRRLLVVDDEPTICSLFTNIGRKFDLDVTATSCSRAFQRAYLNERPTVIALDLQMPEVDGIETLRFLADNHCEAAILLTSGMDMKTISTARHFGASKGLNMAGVLQKPIRVDAIRETLDELQYGADAISPAALENAIRRGELITHYQPIASRTKGWRVDRAEALIRWQHPSRGLVMPQDFIAIAEASDLIMPLTDFVLREAIEQQARWRMAGLNIRMSINLSPTILTDPAFPDHIDELFASYGIDGSDFVFELTENEAIRDTEMIMDVLTRLRLKNFGLSIDDFGSGYSSLKQLFLLPFNELKLDRSIASQIHRNQQARKMMSVMISLARELGMTSCAEGIESIEAAAMLHELGCDKIQGYLISAAVDGNQFPQVVEAWNAEADDPDVVDLSGSPFFTAEAGLAGG